MCSKDLPAIIGFSARVLFPFHMYRKGRRTFELCALKDDLACSSEICAMASKLFQYAIHNVLCQLPGKNNAKYIACMGQDYMT